MQQNQKYFPLLAKTAADEPLPAGVQPATEDPSHIIQGNERVLRARLSDAEFFYKQDPKSDFGKPPAEIVQRGLPQQKSVRKPSASNACKASPHTSPSFGADAAAAERAARLAKADLVTEMVGEFPELQGTWVNTMPAWTAKPKKSPKPSSNTTNRVLPATTAERQSGDRRCFGRQTGNLGRRFGVSA